MLQILISLFGIAIVRRNLSLLEKFELITLKKSQMIFIFLQIPFYILCFFKELLFLVIIYIGIFLITLTLLRFFLSLLAKITYEKRHLQIIDQLILLLKSGKSAQASLKIVLSELSLWEKMIFVSFENIFQIQKSELINYLYKNEFYFEEVQFILRSNHKVIEQLQAFRSGLKIRRDLRHKSRQVAHQIRAQAIVSIFIYVAIFATSYMYLGLKQSTGLMVASMILFVLGECLVFIIGGQIKWKT